MTIRTIIRSLLVSLCLVLSCSQYGFAMTSAETSPFITIPITQWQMLTSESKALSSELIEYKSVIQRLKKPSAELVQQLQLAEKTLLQLQTDLNEQTKDLMLLSKDKDELKTSLTILKQQIEKERRVHKRQLWQNRLWFLLIGAGIGCAVK